MEDKENHIEETTAENINRKLESICESIHTVLSILESSSFDNRRKTADAKRFHLINVFDT